MTENLTVSFNPQSVSATVQAASIASGFGDELIIRNLVERDPYVGDYVITPQPEEVVLNTRGKRMTGDVTVRPIPSNYGLITWNGSVLTVS